MCKCAFLTMLVLLLIAGCSGSKPKFTQEELAAIAFPQKEGLPVVSGGFVLVVGDEVITAEEVTAPLMEHFKPLAQASDFEQFRNRARPQLEQIIENKITNILLYKQAERSAGENIEDALDKAAEAEVKRFTVSFKGDYAKAEEALKGMGMNWTSFKEYQKKMILTQSYMASKMPEKKPITYSELVDSYNKMKDKFFVVSAVLKFRLIDIEAVKLEVTDPNGDRRQLAKDLANELAKRIYAGEDFGILAKQYSHGHRREFGGLWKQVEPGSLAKPYDILAAEAEKIEQGQVAGPIEAGGHIFIMKLEEKQAKGYEPFEKVQKEVEAKISFDRRKQAVDELGAILAQQAKLSDKRKFVNFCSEEIYRMSNE